jgi:hypothetical protein
MNRRDAIIGLGMFLADCSGASTAPSLPLTFRQRIAQGGGIDLPAGTWTIDDPGLTLVKGTRLRGAGIGKTIIMYTGTSHLIVDADDVAITDLTLDGSLCPVDNSGTFDTALVFLVGHNTTYTRVRIQNATGYGAFVFGGIPTIRSCQFDNNGRTNGDDSLGADHSDGSVLYTDNIFTNCNGNAIDNCGPMTGTWTSNTVLSIGPRPGGSGDVIADGGANGVIVTNNTLVVGSIKVYGATPGCVTSNGLPHGCEVTDNVIQVGSLCQDPNCKGLYVIAGNSHSGNTVGGVLVD